MSKRIKNDIVSKMRKKNIGTFFAMVFCTLVIISSMGSSFIIKNSYAQAQIQQQQLAPRQAPTVAYQSPWSNNLQVSSASNSQPLCKAGICNQSSAPASTTQTTNADPTQIANVDPVQTNSHATITNTATSNKPLTLTHQFQSSKIIGPDRFRFINYYWTSSATPRAVDVGTSSSGPLGSNTLGSTTTGLAPLLATAQGPNVKQEVDTNE